VIVLLGVCDIEFARQKLDVERRKTGWNCWIEKCSGVVNRIEVAVEDVDRPRVKVGYVQSGSGRTVSQSQTLVDCAGPGLIHTNKRVRSVDIWIPAGEGAIFSREDERRRPSCDEFKRWTPVKDLPRW